MALITCPDCNREVSSSAASCPGCGYPVAQAIATGGQSAVLPTTTIEQTSKRWKSIKLTAAFLVVIGLLLTMSVPTFGAFVLLLGLSMAIYAGIGSWWHHS